MNFKHLAARLGNIAPFHVMELAKMADQLELEGRHIIHMGIGEPDFTAAAPVIEAANRAMAEGKLRYTSAVGIPALREAIAAHYCRVYGLDVAPGRIIVTAGASAALLLACAALVEKGAEVLMPDPSYPCNRHFVAAFDGRAQMIPCGPELRFQLSDAMVREHWNADTRGVLLASPSNPTGTSPRGSASTSTSPSSNTMFASRKPRKIIAARSSPRWMSGTLGRAVKAIDGRFTGFSSDFFCASS